MRKSFELAELMKPKTNTEDEPAEAPSPGEEVAPMEEDEVSPPDERAVGNHRPPSAAAREEARVEEDRINEKEERRSLREDRREARKSRPSRRSKRRKYDRNSEESDAESDSHSDDSSRDYRRRSSRRSREGENMRRPDTWTPKSLDRSCTGGWIPAQQDLIRLLSASCRHKSKPGRAHSVHVRSLWL